MAATSRSWTVCCKLWIGGRKIRNKSEKVPVLKPGTLPAHKPPPPVQARQTPKLDALLGRARGRQRAVRRDLGRLLELARLPPPHELLERDAVQGLAVVDEPLPDLVRVRVRVRVSLAVVDEPLADLMLGLGLGLGLGLALALELGSRSGGLGLRLGLELGLG
eukprot:scaffold106118_cov54-Phaeocystis_antarctica.AAC.2